MKISGWGKYPVIDSKQINYQTDEDLRVILLSLNKSSCIARGNARSYGDSALSDAYISLLHRNRILSFDETKGLVTCESGVLLNEIISVFLGRGWFLRVTPGTKFITVGGAVASDVHGKNHHLEGCFGNAVESLVLMIASGEILLCSKFENRELFFATCGGMGLTGIILEVSFYLMSVNSSNIDQTTIKLSNLEEIFSAFDKYSKVTYSVAWIDCLAKKESLGRSLLMVGDFSQKSDLSYETKKSISVPFNFPSILLNSFTAKVFNHVYYSKTKNRTTHQLVDIDSFFYPLDKITHWNRIYGRKGFIQYQFILPLKNSYEGLRVILRKISDSDMGSFLAVLKLHGPENNNYLSFPMKGYSLALDFKIQSGLFQFLEELDKIVLEYGGRFYLAKDSRVKKATFEKGYPKIAAFRQLRTVLGLDKKFSSHQSERLGL